MITGLESQLSFGFSATAVVKTSQSKTTGHEAKRARIKKGALARTSVLPRADVSQLSSQRQHMNVSIDDRRDTYCDQHGKETAPETRISHIFTGNQEAKKENAVHGLAVKKQPESRSKTLPEVPQCATDLTASVHEVISKTLYTCTTPLSHFTKSTLARMRAAFRSSPLLELTDLAGIYRDRIVPNKRTDTKYQDTIPKIIKQVSMQRLLGDKRNDEDAKRPHHRSAKKLKIGKNGLYFKEEQHIKNWWLGSDRETAHISDVRSQQQHIHQRLSTLRNRETQLQIILMLEILALESSAEVTESEKAATCSGAQGAVLNEGIKDRSTTTSAKQSKLRDLKPSLDILIDRLCIHHSVDMVASTLVDTVKTPYESSNRGTQDQLKDFCCNVVLPFYSHKLPRLVQDISRKIGGPRIEPQRPAAPKKNNPAPRSESRNVVDPHRRAIQQHTLKRVLSEESMTRHSTLPALTRVATTPTSTTSGESSAKISAKPTSVSRARGSLSRSQSFTNREVDLLASSKAEEAKQKRLASLAKHKEELMAAIQTLRKPHRDVVSRDIMADAERRGLVGQRGAHMFRDDNSRLGLGIEITATPRRNRLLHNEGLSHSMVDDALGNNKAGRTSSSMALDHGEESVPGSVPPREAGLDENCTKDSSIGFSLPLQPPHPSVQETPSRTSESRTSNPLNLPTKNKVQLSSQRSQHLEPATPSQLHTSLAAVKSTPAAFRTLAPTRPTDRSPIANIPSQTHIDDQQGQIQKHMQLQPRENSLVPSFANAGEVVNAEAAISNQMITEKAGKAMERVMGPGRIMNTDLHPITNAHTNAFFERDPDFSKSQCRRRYDDDDDDAAVDVADTRRTFHKASPVKTTTTTMTTTTPPPQQNQQPEKSIYQTLGWDHDDDNMDDLL